MKLLQSLFLAMPNMKELTFDSGLGAATREIPIDVVLAVLEDAKSLQRFDLCDVNITCQGLIDVNQQVSRLESSSTSKVQQALSQVCIDRCYFVQDNDPVNINDNDNRSQQSALDILIQLLIKNLPKLEWFTICPANFEKLSTETLQCLVKTKSLKELMLLNINVQTADQHLDAVFHGLSTNPSSRLVRLTLPTTLSLGGALIVANYLRQPSTDLQGLTLTINCFMVRDNAGKAEAPILASPSVIKEILETIADGLQVNQSLRSFRLRGAAKMNSAVCLPIFANMLGQNCTLEHFSVLNADTESSATSSSGDVDRAIYNSTPLGNVYGLRTGHGIDNTVPPCFAGMKYGTLLGTRPSSLVDPTHTSTSGSKWPRQELTTSEHSLNIAMYLKLNRHGRKQLIGSAAARSNIATRTSRGAWFKTLADSKDDVNCIFYLLQLNPSLLREAGDRDMS